MKNKEICWCYEKYKAQLPLGTKTVCFKEKCANYRKHQQMQQTKQDSDRQI
ncbi:hypothetical protein [Ectobacillus funiculus]|uniref:Uncharacterized protein n=1 Tax=Ectobacillus funiculus TaxID=137993 RepID=A0ABV5WGI3_9BACI